MSQASKESKETASRGKDGVEQQQQQQLQDDQHYSLQDRLFATIISQVVPTQHMPRDNKLSKSVIGIKPKEGPEFSVRLMAHNFRRFNARIGFFVPMQKSILQVFTWQQPTATLSFLALHTLVCLEPRMLPALPFAAIIFGIMIPSFLALHPTPSNDAEVGVGSGSSAASKLPHAPPAELEPVPEFSAEFWRNLAVLQNSMGEFAELYDTVNDDLLACVNFSDEAVASALFPVLVALAFVATFGTSLLSWQLSALVGGWLVALGGHPAVQSLLSSLSDIQRLRTQLQALQVLLRQWSATALVGGDSSGAGAATTPSERRQVEIFELQRHHTHSDTWEPWLFSPAPFEPLSAARITGTRAKGTQFFEDVQAPAGWAWSEPKWHLDLFSREWVEQRLITGVEIETEGERWVYDMPPEEDEEEGSPATELLDGAARGREMRRRTSSVPKSGWQETAALERRGEWRRRRWTRLVERKPAVAKRKADVPPA